MGTPEGRVTSALRHTRGCWGYDGGLERRAGVAPLGGQEEQLLNSWHLGGVEPDIKTAHPSLALSHGGGWSWGSECTPRRG